MIDAPRLPTGRAVLVLRDLEIGDDGVYTDLDVVQGRLANTVAKNVRIERACLRDTDLSRVRLDRLTLADVRVEAPRPLANGVWRDATIDRTEFIGCRLTGLDMADASLRHVVMRQCQGALISFRSATLKNSRLEDCSFTEVDFQDAQLPGLIVRGSDLRGASVYGANLKGSDLRGSVLDELKDARDRSDRRGHRPGAARRRRPARWRRCSASAFAPPRITRRPPDGHRPGRDGWAAYLVILSPSAGAGTSKALTSTGGRQATVTFARRRPL